MAFDAFRAWLTAVRDWLVNMASTCCRRARPAARYAWETSKERLIEAGRQAMADVAVDLATAFKEWIAPTP